jgi:hypothetical protein
VISNSGKNNVFSFKQIKKGDVKFFLPGCNFFYRVRIRLAYAKKALCEFRHFGESRESIGFRALMIPGPRLSPGRRHVAREGWFVNLKL